MLRIFGVVAGLSIIFAFSITSAVAETRVALVIGNSDYKHTTSLRNPANDAAMIARRLREQGFDVHDGTNLSLTGMNEAVRTYTNKLAAAGSDAVGVVYYAGHGIQIKDMNYLVPVDADLQSAVDVKFAALSLNWMLEVIETTGNALNIVILDACRDNPFKIDLKTRGGARGLARVQASQGMLIAYATSPGQTAADGDGENSPYAKAIAEVLPEAGLTVEAVFKRVRVKVHEATAGKQTPWENTSLFTDFYFNPKAGVGTESSQPDTIAPTPQTPDRGAGDARMAYYRALEQNTLDGYEAFLRNFPNDPKARDVREIVRSISDENFWTRMSRENSASAFRRYLRAFPKGNYIQEARNRIAGLSEKPAPAPASPRSFPRRITLLDRISPTSSWAISNSRNCVRPSKAYSLKYNSPYIIWRDGLGNVDIELVLSSSENEFTTRTYESRHVTKKNVEIGQTWTYRNVGGSRIQVFPGGKSAFHIAKCS